MAEQTDQTSLPAIAPPGGGSSSQPQLVDLPNGKGYTLATADEITRQHLTNVILFAGTAGSGKTTLLASLYLLFHKKPFAGYLFAGSRSLVGFEQRVYLARVASDRSEATTERSRLSELLHLRVRKQDSDALAKDLLLCDLIGEDFREAKDSTELCRKQVVIRRADVFVLLVDGAKLASLASRQQAKSDPMSLLQNCLDCEMLTETCNVDVLFTKWDVVQSDVDRPEIEVFAKYVQGEFTRCFSARVGRLRFAHVAAHPTKPDWPLGYGLDTLFQSWVEHPTGAALHRYRHPAEPSNACEYDRYWGRRLPAGSVGGPLP